MGKFYRRRALRRWALILGLIGACTAAFVIWFIFAFAKGRITDPIGWLFVLFPLCSIAITLKWSVVGGVLHILESLVLTGLFSMAGIQVIGLLGSAGTQPGSTSWWISRSRWPLLWRCAPVGSTSGK